MLKFSKANTKIKQLAGVPSIAQYLGNDKKIYSFDLLSGWACPFAQDCYAKVYEDSKGSRSIQDGPKTEFRCFSASQEALHTNVYKLRKHNYEVMKSYSDSSAMAIAILESMPKNAGVVRIHVAGDFFNREYFKAWVKVAKERPEILFYAYTKSLPYWVENKSECDIIDNLVLTASRGGRRDDLIKSNGLRSVSVVMSEGEAEDFDLPIDHDDSHAADPSQRFNNFALLIHGTQPAGSVAGKAVKALKGVGSYGK